MGVYDNIGFDRMPRQGSWMGKRARVCFHYNPKQYLYGSIVRDDAEARTLGDHQSDPICIIKLDNGRFVLSTECQISPLNPGDKEVPCVEPGSIDDPQSLAYDLANSPFNENEMPRPFEGMWWLMLDRDGDWLNAAMAAHVQAYTEDQQKCRVLAAKYDAVNVCGFPDKNGRLKIDSFLVDTTREPVPYSKEFQAAETERRRKRISQRWYYQPNDAPDEWMKYPNKGTKAGRAVIAELEELRNSLDTGLALFVDKVLVDLNLYVVGNGSRNCDIVIADSRVWIGVPEGAGANLHDRDLIPVAYSKVVHAIESDQHNDIDYSDKVGVCAYTD